MHVRFICCVLIHMREGDWRLHETSSTKLRCKCQNIRGSSKSAITHAHCFTAEIGKHSSSFVSVVLKDKWHNQAKQSMGQQATNLHINTHLAHTGNKATCCSCTNQLRERRGHLAIVTLQTRQINWNCLMCAPST